MSELFCVGEEIQYIETQEHSAKCPLYQSTKTDAVQAPVYLLFALILMEPLKPKLEWDSTDTFN